MRWFVLSLLLCSAGVSSASIIAVIDSGVDYRHQHLSDRMWINEFEAPDNGVDEDFNGFIDDVYGWNFFDSTGEVIDYKYQTSFTEDVKKFFSLQSKGMKETLSEEERDWVKERLRDQEFIKNLRTFGNYAHGTHVGGIVADKNPLAQVLAAKLLPTENPFAELQERVVEIQKEERDVNRVSKWFLKAGLRMIASTQAQLFRDVSKYIAGHRAQVANISMGIGMPQARMVLEPVLKVVLMRNDIEKKILDEYAQFFVQEVVKKQTAMLSDSPETLFVFAAGNDGTDNDQLPTAPANIVGDNKITVAACLGNQDIAVFSNYGIEKVEVCADGVAVKSSVPGGHFLEMSGTSQAAPRVARVAAMVFDANPDLTPSEVKNIIVNTVDKKEFLEQKVSSGGIINPDRALEAAYLSAEYSLDYAVLLANRYVSDALDSIKRQDFPLFVQPLASFL